MMDFTEISFSAYFVSNFNVEIYVYQLKKEYSENQHLINSPEH